MARDAVPSLPYLDERFLHQILRLGGVGGHQAQRPEQPGVLALEECSNTPARSTAQSSAPTSAALIHR